MTFGEKIQGLRKSKGLSQERLAEMVNVSRQAISKWELGEAMPEVENVKQLSKALGASIDYLLGDHDAPECLAETVIADTRTPRRVWAGRASYLLLGVGLLGILAMWILSSVIPAQKTVPDFRGAPASVLQALDPSAESQSPAQDEEIQFYTSAEVRGDLAAFLETYYLRGLFALLCALTITGAGLLAYSFKIFRKKRA